MKFSIKDFFSKYDQIRMFLRVPTSLSSHFHQSGVFWGGFKANVCFDFIKLT